MASQTRNLAVLSVDLTEVDGKLEEAIAIEKDWIVKVSELVERQNSRKGDQIAWATYHASNQPKPSDPPAVSTLLPLFYEKAASLAVI